jgi:hypothetical protein
MAPNATQKMNDDEKQNFISKLKTKRYNANL